MCSRFAFPLIGFVAILALASFGAAALQLRDDGSAVPRHAAVQYLPTPEAVVLRSSRRVPESDVEDGDSFWLGDFRIRLEGIDAPELYQKCPGDDDDERCGRKARSALIGILNSENIECRVPRGKEDRPLTSYSRFVAECEVDGESINRKMVAQGHALASPKQPDVTLARLQQNAQSSMLGMHKNAGFGYTPWDFRRIRRGRSRAELKRQADLCQVELSRHKGGETKLKQLTLLDLPGTLRNDQ